MAKQVKQFCKVGLVLMSFLAFAACSSSSDTEDMGQGSQTAAVSNPGSSRAQSTAGSGTNRLTQEEIRTENALRQTVFYFDFDVDEFKAEDRQTLTYHARDLAANPNKRVRLEGHADERGTREYNLALGERRGNGIMNYLIVNGASRSQLEVVSYGEERPAASGATEQSYSRNRRVEIVPR